MEFTTPIKISTVGQLRKFLKPFQDACTVLLQANSMNHDPFYVQVVINLEQRSFINLSPTFKK